ncbi:MAG: hypothetical protein ABEH81_07335 [Halopenitus sp.]
MAEAIAAVVGDYRRRPLALLAVAATLVVPFAFVALVPVIATLGQMLLYPGLLAVALAGQTARVISAPATGFALALLDGEPPRAAMATARTRAADRVVAAVVERLVVIPVTVVVGVAGLLVALAVATAAGAGLSAMGVPAPQSGPVVLAFGVFGLLAIGAGVGAVFRLGSEVADVPHHRRPAASLAVARSASRTTARLVGLRMAPWVALLLTAAVTLLVDSVSLPSAVVMAIVLAVAVAATALAVGLERRVIEDSVEAIPPLRSSLPARRAVVAVGLVLVILTVPTLGVRVADARPSPATAAPIDSDDGAAAIVTNANDALRQVDHFRDESTRLYNDSTGRMDPVFSFDVGLNPSDREYRIHVDAATSDPAALSDMYYADGTLAMEREYHPSGPVQALFVRDAGNWTVVAAPMMGIDGYTQAEVADTLESHGTEVEQRHWRVLARGDEAVTVGVEDPERLASAFGVPAANVSADSHVRLVVDADTGRPKRLSLHRNVTTSAGHRERRVVVRYRDWERHDVERPDAIGDQGSFELFWDALGY